MLSFFALLFLHFYVPRFIVEIKNPIVEMVRGSNSEKVNPRFENKLKGRYIHFKSFDNVELSSYFTYSALDTVKGTIILLHGIRSRKESFISLSSKLSKLGYNTVALDIRAHGESKGAFCTFGVKEKKDISALINELEKKENITTNIGVWGKSLGGGIGLQAMGIDHRIKFGIIESTFTDFRTITHDYFKYHLGFNSKPLTNYLLYRAGEIAEFDPDEAKPIQYCEKIEQPILIIHGNQDKRIDIKYARANFAKISSKQKEFIEIDKANHVNVSEIGGLQHFQRILEFIDTNTNID